MEYQDFLENKKIRIENKGIDVPIENLNPNLFEWQKHIVKWALKRGKSALFEDCGLGKTIQQLEWANQINLYTQEPVLILAPIAVSYQTLKEGEKFGIKANIAENEKQIINGINITNYEKLHKFNCNIFSGVCLDESSILKSFSGKIRNQIIELFMNTSFKLACTATPSPNDYEELGNHTEFLNIKTRLEMLSEFFVHDSGDTSNYRLKAWAEDRFWEWVSLWAVMIQKPSDIGFDDNGFILPEIEYKEVYIEHDPFEDGELFTKQVKGMNGRMKVRRSSLQKRCEKAAEVANSINDQVFVFCKLNDESETSAKLIDGCREIQGKTKESDRIDIFDSFVNGNLKSIISKVEIAGYGMNFQNCCNVISVGLTDSFEEFYQMVRRFWRYGQKRKVTAYIILDEREGTIVENIQKKEAAHLEMAENMRKYMSLERLDIFIDKVKDEYEEIKIEEDRYTIYRGDSFQIAPKIKDESIDFTVFSPPFLNLFCYSDSIRDIGNSKTKDQFFEHFDFLIKEIYRTTKPGRLCAVHCQEMAYQKEKHGFIGIYDFPGDIIRAFEKQGFIQHCPRITIWKDPLIEATRTHSLRLLHCQIEKDSTRCGVGTPDSIVVMRKPGDNAIPIKHENGFIDYIGENTPKTNNARSFSEFTWRSYASPVWTDIRQTETLNTKNAKEKDNEPHICPLQLDSIERLIELYSNENEVVYSWFAGIGSEGYVALKKNRKFVGVELKRSYFNEMIKNLKMALSFRKQLEFDFEEAV